MAIELHTTSTHRWIDPGWGYLEYRNDSEQWDDGVYVESECEGRDKNVVVYA